MYTYPSVVLYKTATLGCESNQAWLVNNETELTSAINAIFKATEPIWKERSVKVETLTAFTAEARIMKHCKQIAEKAFGGQIFIKKVAYNQTKNTFNTWDI